LVGDLALLGKPILGKIVADRAGMLCIPPWFRAFSATKLSGKK